MRNNKMKKYKKLLDGAETVIIVTDKGQIVQGVGGDVLTLYTILTKVLVDQGNKEAVEYAYKMAYMSTEELLSECERRLKEFTDKLSKE